MALFIQLLLIFFYASNALCLDHSDILKHEISMHQQRLKKLDHDIKKQCRKAVKVEKSKIEVLTQLQKLDVKIEESWKRLEQVKKKWTAAELELEKARQDIKIDEKKVNDLKKYIESRLIALREMGMVGALNIMFEAASIPDLMSREQYLKLILKHDRLMRMKYQQKLVELAPRKAMLEKEKAGLSQLSQDVEQQALLLETRKREKTAFLQELKKQGKKYAVMLKELKQAGKALQGVIEELNKELLLRQGPSETDMFDFAAQKGHLTPPVMGGSSPVYSARRNNTIRGMIIAAPWGTEIRAIFDGRVIFNRSLPGYGKILIIDHGNRYMSLTAQGASFFKKEGDEVMEGDVVGISGGGTWVKEGIYFELRHGKKQENPLVWFDFRGTGKSHIRLKH